MPDSGNTIDYIKRIVKHYTPEWFFDEENPDLGAAFALAFAHMADEGARRFERLMQKHYIAFLNCIALEPRPLQSAGGYAAFTLAPGAPHGETIPAGTVLYNEDTDAPYTVEDDLYVSPAVLKEAYSCYGDGIYQALEAGKLAFFSITVPNLQEHALIVFHKWVFAQISRGGVIELEFGERDWGKKTKPGEDIEWFYSTGEGFQRFEKVSYNNGRLSLTVGHAAFVQTEIDGNESCFIRAVPGKNAVLGDVKAQLSAVCVHNDEAADVRFFNRDGEAVWFVRDGAKTKSGECYPFGKNLVRQDCFYIACDEAFSKKSATITAAFSLAAETITPVGVIAEELIKRPPVQLLRVSVDYWNGKDFVSLLPYIENTSFAMPGQEYSERSVVFVCPGDMEPLGMNGIESRWVRVRILEVSDVFQGSVKYEVPVIKDVKVSYSCRLDTPDGVMLKDNLKTSVFSAWDKPIHLFKKLPFSNAPNLCLGFDKLFGGTAVSFLIEPSPENSAAEWSFYQYAGEDSWVRLPVIDKTDGFTATGIVTFLINEQCEPFELFGNKLFWLRAEQAMRTEGSTPVPMSIKRFWANAVGVTQKSPWRSETFIVDSSARDGAVHLKLGKENPSDIMAETNAGQQLPFVYDPVDNAVTADISEAGPVVNINVRYRVSLGSAGNCPENKVTGLPASAGFAQSVTNPFPMSGGRSAEPAELMAIRSAATLRHRRRAVAAEDFEALARECAGELAKCKCCGKNGRGEDITGYVTLIYISEGFPATYLDLHEPTAELSNMIKAYLRERSHPLFLSGDRLTVREASYIPVSVTVTIVLDTFRNSLTLRERITSALDGFLNPVTGGFKKDGFGFGEFPSEWLVTQFLYTLPGVDKLEKLSVEYDASAEVKPYTAPISGKHVVNFRIRKADKE